MAHLNRRNALKSAIVGRVLGGIGSAASPTCAGAADANSEVRLAIIGLGGIDVPSSVGGRGRQLIKAIQSLPRARIVSLCDVDQHILNHGVELLKKANQNVSAHTDLRRVFDALIGALSVNLNDRDKVVLSDAMPDFRLYVGERREDSRGPHTFFDRVDERQYINTGKSVTAVRTR